MKQKYVLYLLFIFIYFLHQTIWEVNQGGRASQVKKEDISEKSDKWIFSLFFIFFSEKVRNA